MDHDFFDGAEEVNNDQQSSIKTTSPSKKDEQKKLTIEFFGTDLTAEAKENMLDPVI
jgi:ATP-dependent Clp protease ATP-binding subunit ClpA